MRTKARLTINIEPEILKALHTLAKREDRSASDYLRRLVRNLAVANGLLSVPEVPVENMHNDQHNHAAAGASK